MKPGEKEKEAGSSDREQVCSVVLNQGRTLVGRETLQEGDFFDPDDLGCSYPRLNWNKFRVTLYLSLSHKGGEMENGEVGIWRLFQYGP